MIIHFFHDYSQQSRIRREFAHDPTSVLDRYEIPAAQQDVILRGDRSGIARLLHSAIDYYMDDNSDFIWIEDLPLIVGIPNLRAGAAGQPLELEIRARNLAATVGVRFASGAAQGAVDAEILSITPEGDTQISVIHCRATFPAAGTYDLIVANHQDFEHSYAIRQSCFCAVMAERTCDDSSDLRPTLAPCLTFPSRLSGRRRGLGEDRVAGRRAAAGRDKLSRGASGWWAPPARLRHFAAGPCRTASVG